MSFDSLVLETETDRIGLNPDGGYVSSWSSFDTQSGQWKDVLYVGSELKRSGIPVLFPYFGKSEGLPQHGFARKCRWSITLQSSSACELFFYSADLSDEFRSWYPFLFRVHIAITLLEPGRLDYSLRVENESDVEMPIVPGIHPYWAIPHGEKGEIGIEGLSEFDAASFDWTNSPPDVKYDFLGLAEIVFPDRRIEITDLSKTVKYLVVWSLTPLRDPDFDFVCIEPVCGYNYDFERAPLLIPPRSQWEMNLRFHVRFV